MKRVAHGEPFLCLASQLPHLASARKSNVPKYTAHGLPNLVSDIVAYLGAYVKSLVAKFCPVGRFPFVLPRRSGMGLA